MNKLPTRLLLPLLIFFVNLSINGEISAFEIDVAAEGFIPYFDMVIDSSGLPHIAYDDTILDQLFYTTKIIGVWKVPEFVSSTSDVGSSAVSLQLGSLGFHHVVFDSGIGDNDVFTYTEKSLETWPIDIVRTNSRWYSLALDNLDNPHVAYYHDFSGLNYAIKRNGVWSHENVDSSGSITVFTGRYPKLVLDSSNKAHIVYFDYLSQSIKYANNSDGIWTIETIATRISLDGSLTEFTGVIAIDSIDILHVAYSIDRNVYYAKKTRDGWIKELVVTGNYAIGEGAIAIDDPGMPYVLYKFISNDAIFLSKKSAGIWDQRVVYTGGVGQVWGGTLRIAQGNLHIAVSDTGARRLFYLHEPVESPHIISVSIDIKPGESPNSINPRSKGVIPVAILNTDTFDATSINPLSVEFGPAGATETHGRGHIEDANGDGKPDLVLHFETQETGIQCGDTSASLTGQTFSGQDIVGLDAITTVGCR